MIWKVVWRYAFLDYGEQFVTIIGTLMKLQLCADSWVTLLKVYKLVFNDQSYMKRLRMIRA